MGACTISDGSWVELSGKMGVLARLLANIRETTDDRIVLVSNYTQVSAAQILDFIFTCNYTCTPSCSLVLHYYRYSGSLNLFKWPLHVLPDTGPLFSDMS